MVTDDYFIEKGKTNQKFETLTMRNISFAYYFYFYFFGKK